MALVFRSLNGLLNGNTGVAKTYMKEITDNTNEAKGFAFINLVWGLGAIIGPSVGGLLANPVESFPEIFNEGSHFDSHPYVLPCILSSVFSLFGFVTGYFFLRETLLRKASVEALPLLDENCKIPDNDAPVPSQREVLKSLLRDKQVMSTVILYGIVAFVEIVFDEIQSFWLMLSPSEGGCGFSSKEIGIQIAITGALLIIFQTLLYHKLSNKVGILHLFRCSLIGLAIALTAYPFTSKLAYENDGINIKLWGALLPLGLLKTWCGGAVFSTTMVMISNSTTLDKIGAVNGLGQSVASLLRAAGPVVGGSLFAWSNTNGLDAPFDYHLVFFLMGLVCIGTAFSTTGLSKSLETRKE